MKQHEFRQLVIDKCGDIPGEHLKFAFDHYKAAGHDMSPANAQNCAMLARHLAVFLALSQRKSS